MLAFCFAVMLCLILDLITVFHVENSRGEEFRGNCFDWLRQRVLRMNFWQNYDARMTDSSPWIKFMHVDSGERLIQLAQDFILLASECILVGLNIVLITDFTRLLLPGNDFQALDLKAWSLGQVIAVTIWTPVFVEYIWTAIGTFFFH